MAISSFAADRDLIVTFINTTTNEIVSLSGQFGDSGADLSPGGGYQPSHPGYAGPIEPGATLVATFPDSARYGFDGGSGWGFEWTTTFADCTSGGFDSGFIPVTGFGAATVSTPNTETVIITDPCAPAPAVYTNYTYCVNNTDPSRIMQTTWYFNGAQVKQSLIFPSGQDCYTTPPIEVSPTPQNFTESSTSTFPTATFLNPETNGTITFQPPSETSGNSGSGGNGSDGSGGSQTNTVTPPPPTVTQAPTNIVTFPTPTGVASESTLNSGFQLLHGDMVNLLSGQKIQNDSINNGFFATTNALGQVVNLLYSNVNVDGMWLPRIYAAITNSNPTNQIAGDTNFFNASSNVWVQNFPTNLDQEATQQGISNLLAGSLLLSNEDLTTNFAATGIVYTVDDEDTNGPAAVASAQAALGSTFLGSINTATNGIGNYLGQTIPDGSAPDFTISIPLAGVHFDANPVTRFPWFFLFVHAIVTWMTVVAFLYGAIKTIYDVLHDYAAAQTGGVPNMTGGSGGGKGVPLTPI